MLQEAALRLEGVTNASAPIIVCNEEHRFLVAEQMHQLGFKNSQIILEPCGRNTAPALALAALAVAKTDPDAELLIMPADHVIKDVRVFADAVEKGCLLSQQDKLVTFGITPTSPHTGYGYIKRGQALEGGFSVEAFVEKPDRGAAESYIASGDYLWNSGIFLFKASNYLAALKDYAPDILANCQVAYEKRSEDMDFLRVAEDAFAECRSESIDYAVMEHTTQAAVVPMSPGWSDIGARYFGQLSGGL